MPASKTTRLHEDEESQEMAYSGIPQEGTSNGVTLRAGSPPDSLQQYGQPSKTLSSSLAALESFQQTETAESRLVFDDEAYTRQLAAEEEEELRNRFERKAKIESERHQPEPEKLPQYTTEGLLAPDLQSDDSHSIQSSSSLPVANPPSHAQPAPAMASAPRPATSFEAAQQSLPQFRGEPYQGQPYDCRVQSIPTTSAPGQSFSEPPPGRTDKPHSHLNPLRPAAYHASTFPNAAVGSSNGAQVNHVSSTGLSNHFIDRELLMGVSIGFKPPVLSTNLVPMKDLMPNIITLSATRCPPLHLQAPDWRHMLRLLARLGDTRIEPTVEALSASKTALELRTVVQFIKPHQLSSTWRTILWFTIDHAVPSNVPGAQRYLSGNPNILPWSYTLSPVPMLLRDAADTPLSKTYTIPPTEAVPLPELPITFPNLLIYLHLTLQQSRSYSRSSDAGGLGKLGKMVETCYPNVTEEDYEDDMPRSF